MWDKKSARGHPTPRMALGDISTQTINARQGTGEYDMDEQQRIYDAKANLRLPMVQKLFKQNKGGANGSFGEENDDDNPKSKKQLFLRNITNNEVAAPPHQEVCYAVQPEQAVHNEPTLEYLDKTEPRRVMNFVEDLVHGVFVKLTDAQYQNRIQQAHIDNELQDDKNDDRFDYDMYKVNESWNMYIYRMMFIVQGLLAGITIMHSLVLLQFKSIQDALVQYSDKSLRAQQIMLILSLISLTGALQLRNIANDQLNISVRQQLGHIGEFRNVKTKADITFLAYLFVWVMLIFLHVLVAQIWAKQAYLPLSELMAMHERDMRVYIALNVVNMSICIVGWITSAATSKSPIELFWKEDDVQYEGEDEDPIKN